MKPHELQKKLGLLGWVITRKKGSHFIYRRRDQTISIPQHKGADLSPGSLAKIAKVNNFSIKDFKRFK